MSNLEELIEIRNESIKTQKEALKMIENAIKENSITYYNNLNEILEEEAKRNPISDPTVFFTNDIGILSINYGKGKEFLRWCEELTNNNITEKVLQKYISSYQSLFNQIICVEPIECKKNDKTKEQDSDKKLIYIRPSYIKEEAKKDNFSFEVQEANEENNLGFSTYTIIATIPKLEFKESRTKSEELDKIREAANQSYIEQLEIERNIIERQLLENSIDYYTRVLYSNLKSNVENILNFNYTNVDTIATAKIINSDNEITASAFETLAKDFKVLKSSDVIRNIKLDEDPIMYIKNYDESWILRYSYLVELAKKDGLILEIKSIQVNDVRFNLVKQNLQELELPKHKVLTLED